MWQVCRYQKTFYQEPQVLDSYYMFCYVPVNLTFVKYVYRIVIILFVFCCSMVESCVHSSVCNYFASSRSYYRNSHYVQVQNLKHDFKPARFYSHTVITLSAPGAKYYIITYHHQLLGFWQQEKKQKVEICRYEYIFQTKKKIVCELLKVSLISRMNISVGSSRLNNLNAVFTSNIVSVQQ